MGLLFEGCVRFGAISVLQHHMHHACGSKKNMHHAFVYLATKGLPVVGGLHGMLCPHGIGRENWDGECSRAGGLKKIPN